MTETPVLPLGQTIPEADLEKNFVKLSDEPYGNDDLAYSIVLPNDWIQIGLEAKDDILHADHPKLLSNIVSPTDRGANAMLQVWCQGLIKEISAADWLKWYLVEAERDIASLQILSPYFADAQAEWEIDGVPYTMRVATRLAGNRLFMIQGMVPTEFYPDYAETFGLSVASFKVTKEFENPHVELWQTHTLDNAISFHAPYSWPERKPEQSPEGMDAVDLFNLNADADAVGVLKAMVIRRELTEGKDDLDLASLIVMEFDKMGVEVIAVASDEPLPVAEPFLGGRLKILTARLPNGDDRLRNLLIAEVTSPAHNVLVGLLTCAPNAGFYEYAVNRRAFDIVMQTTQLADN